MLDKNDIEEIKNDLLECFDSSESFLHLGLKLKRLIRFHVAIFFEIDWKTTSLVPVNFFPSATRKILRLKNVFIPLDSSIIDIFSHHWIPLSQEGQRSSQYTEYFGDLPDPFFLFPLKVKQRVLSAIGISGLKYKSKKDLEDLSSLFHQLSPVLEKNMLIDKTVRRNQRLETILGLGMTTHFVVNRAGYISEFIPCKRNFLGYTTENVMRKPVSFLFPNGEAILKIIWKQLKNENNRISALVKLTSDKKNLVSLTVEKVLLKYTLQKEYYLLGMEPLEGELCESLPVLPSTADKSVKNSFIVKIHICPENLRCIRRCGKLAQYAGEGKFIIDNPSFIEERCNDDRRCLTELTLICDNPDSDVAGK